MRVGGSSVDVTNKSADLSWDSSIHEGLLGRVSGDLA